jgi:predicted double-glycine peptidase
MVRSLFMVGKLPNPLISAQSSQRFPGFLVKRTLLILLVFLIFGVWPFPSAQAAEVMIFMQGGGTFTKPVQSLKARRLRQVVPQTTDYSCGAASLATVLKYHFGHRITEKDAILGMFKYGEQEKIRRRGFSLLDMKRFALEQGLQAKGYRVPDINLLKQVNIPAITLIETNQYKHFVVIRRTDDRFVYLSDPSWGNRKMTLADFQKYRDPAILVLFGPCLGTPEGLYREVADEYLSKYQALRAEGLFGHRFAMDPTNAIVFFTQIPETTSLSGLMQPVSGFFSR